MRRERIWRIAAAGGIAAAALVGTALLAHPVAGPLAALALIAPGEWQLREAGSTAAPRSLCLGDPQILIQLSHPGMRCTRFIVDDTDRSTTVHYTCPGAGHGRTTIKVETPTLFQLETQGIADGAPFEFDYQARRVGDCTPR